MDEVKAQLDRLYGLATKVDRDEGSITVSVEVPHGASDEETAEKYRKLADALAGARAKSELDEAKEYLEHTGLIVDARRSGEFWVSGKGFELTLIRHEVRPFAEWLAERSGVK